ncbi:unnamed protein product, partial [Dicrocoelium dendriticum]
MVRFYWLLVLQAIPAPNSKNITTDLEPNTRIPEALLRHIYRRFQQSRHQFHCESCAKIIVQSPT